MASPSAAHRSPAWRGLAAFAAALIVVGCGGASARGQHGPRLSVRPAVGLADAGLVVRISGVRPGELVTVEASATDATDQRWVSSATYRADRGGMLSTASAAPLTGSYSGADPVGLLWSMRPANGADPRLAFFVPPLQGWTVSFRAFSAYRQVGEASATRQMHGPGASDTPLFTRTSGFVGRYFASGSSGHAAVLVFDGSDPGMQVPLDIASVMASHGIPALSLCYFGCPGVRANLERIPLEYFVAALQWLRRQPRVDPRRVWVLGISRGSEAALLLGATFPWLIHGVIAIVPSNVVNEALLNFYKAIADSPWTLHGQPLPYTKQFGNPHPTDVPEAIIPVQQIQGPVLLIAAHDDQLWPSPAYSQAIMAALTEYRRPFARLLLDLPAAGHDISETVPNLPAGTSVPFDGRVYSLGGTRQGNQNAKARFWEAMLKFIQTH